MKHLKFLALLLCLAILLCGCKGKKVPTETTEPTESSESSLTEMPTEPAETLEVLHFGSFSGVYVEDGSDETVENVACILVHNRSEGYIDYAVLHAQFGDAVGEFVLTGIPAGGTAWVLEANRLSLKGGEEYAYLDQTISQIRTEEMIDPRVEVEFQNGAIILRNISSETIPTVQIYYKQLHTDGNFLGGITYTVTSHELAVGQDMTVLTNHSKEGACTLVRLTCEEG